MAVKKKTTKTLAKGRPPTAQKPKSISRKATRGLINTIHQLEKEKAQAVARGDKAAEVAAGAEIAALGGIQKYQQASLQGQRSDRGGDSSRVLMEWLNPEFSAAGIVADHSVRMLEVGALSTNNECSRSGFFEMQRIDLNSQGDGILQQDFMKRPLPSDDTQTFDVISLSLVLNFVPDAQGRGAMLLRTLDFLKKSNTTKTNNVLPCLFLVLPAPCVTNSRYMDEPLLERIMTALGYTKTHSKITQKLVYYLLAEDIDRSYQHTPFRKVELRSWFDKEQLLDRPPWFEGLSKLQLGHVFNTSDYHLPPYPLSRTKLDDTCRVRMGRNWVPVASVQGSMTGSRSMPRASIRLDADSSCSHCPDFANRHRA